MQKCRRPGTERRSSIRQNIFSESRGCEQTELHVLYTEEVAYGLILARNRREKQVRSFVRCPVGVLFKASSIQMQLSPRSTSAWGEEAGLENGNITQQDGKAPGATNGKLPSTERALSFGRWLMDPVLYTLRPPVWRTKTMSREWKALRSDWRYPSSAFCYIAPPFHLFWMVKIPLLIVLTEILLLEFLPSGVAQFLEGDSTIFNLAFGICSFALSLLLATRVNNVINRFNLARGGIGKLSSVSVTIVHIVLTYCDDEEILQDIARWSVIYHNSVRKLLEGNLKLCDDPVDYNSFLYEDEQVLMHDSRKMRQMAQMKIRQLIAKSKPPLDAAIALNSQLEMAQVASGECVRIYCQSLPYAFTMMTTGFLQIWIYLLPLDLRQAGLQLTKVLPATIFTVLLLLGVDAIAIQYENPYKFIPLRAICDSTERDVYRALNEHKLLLASAKRNAGRPPPPGAVRACDCL